MKDLKIGIKVIIAPAIAIIFLLILGVFSNNALKSNEHTLDNLVNQKFETYKQDTRLMADINLYNSILYKVFNYASGGYEQKLIDEEIKNLNRLGKVVDNEFKTVASLPFLSEQEHKLFKELSVELKIYKNSVDRKSTRLNSSHS